jgi:Ca2+-binding RTX toxin-like protein
MAYFPGTAGQDYHNGTAGTDQIDGGDGSDILNGAGGDDLIDGGADFDQIDGGEGTDIVHGGEGNDSLRVSGSSAGTPENDQLFGDGGDDFMDVYLTAERSDSILLDGGDGHDRIVFHAWYYGQDVTIAGGTGNDSVDVVGGGAIEVDLGAGNDNFSFNYAERASTYSITLGAGSDLVIARRMSWNPGETVNPIRITDFAAGTAGDRISIDRYLTPGGAADWPVNPFASGHLELVQRGSDSVLRMDDDGGGDSYVDFIVFEGVEASSLTAHNIGYAPDGGATPGLALDGDDSPNLLAGGGGADVLRGFASYDDIFGGGGDDRLEGGEGGDTLDGGLGDDVMLGEAGDDNLSDNLGGDDRLYGGAGYDRIEVRRGGQAASTLLLDGGDGYDQLNYSASFATGFVDTVTLIGGLDGDSISSGAAAVSTIDAGAGDDVVYIYNVVYQNRTTLHTITLGAGRDRLVPEGGWHVNGVAAVTDFETGVLGDRIDLHYYLRDALTGWDPDTNPYDTGYLRLVQRGAATVLQIDRDGAGGASAFTDFFIFANSYGADFRPENLGTPGRVTVFGTSAGDTIRGSVGSDRIESGEGSDILHPWVGGGDDTVLAGAGNDNIFFIGSLTGADVVNGGEGTDTLILQGPYGSLALSANVTQIENISILGGNNTNFGEPGTNRYDYVLIVNNANFAAGVQARINGAALLADEDFTFDGSAETDAMFVVYGGKGKDTMLGGQGNDIFFFGEERFASGDTVNGGPGYDGMFLRGNYGINFGFQGYTGLFTSIENLTLTSATDERYARGGGTEFDYFITLIDANVGAGETLTVSGALLTANESMMLDGGLEVNGSLRLFGGAAADRLLGGNMADLIHGNLGGDELRGDGGADVFRYHSIEESMPVAGKADTITDFASGIDRIDLSRIDANSLVAGNQAFAWIGSDAFTGVAGELRVHFNGIGWLVEGDVDGDAVTDLYIGMLLQGPWYSALPPVVGDFIL